MKIKYESVTGEVMEIDVPSEVAEICIEIGGLSGQFEVLL